MKENTILYVKWTSDSSCTADCTNIARRWAKEKIDGIACRNIIKGYLSRSLRPDEPIKRKHEAVMFTCALNYDATSQAFSMAHQTKKSTAQMVKVLVLAFELKLSKTSRTYSATCLQPIWQRITLQHLGTMVLHLETTTGTSSQMNPSLAHNLWHLCTALNL